MIGILKRLFGPCPFGHSADYFTRRAADGRRMKECPRCHELYAVELGGEMLKDGAAKEQAPCAGVPTGRAMLKDPPPQKVAQGKFGA